MNDRDLLFDQLAKIAEASEKYPDKRPEIDVEFEFRGTQDEHGAPCWTSTGYRTVTIKYYLP